MIWKLRTKNLRALCKSEICSMPRKTTQLGISENNYNWKLKNWFLNSVSEILYWKAENWKLETENSEN